MLKDSAASLAVTTSPPESAIDYLSYDFVVIAFSGGKDSLAALLLTIEQGCPLEKIELWHHDIDGQEGSKLMDWACTRDYCRKIAQAFGAKIYFSWKQGGFEREMNRCESNTAPVCFETPDGLRTAGGERESLNTRQKFPQTSADLSVRWCSSYLKIDVGARALVHQERFRNVRTLFITGERAEESSQRARYKTFEPHKSDLRNGKLRRHIDHSRPVHGWSEKEVWAIIEKHSINPHPAYRLGWGRVSCAACIFGNSDQWASLAKINEEQVARISAYEEKFGVTIQRKLSVLEQVAKGTPYKMKAVDVKAALSDKFNEPVRLAIGKWKLPAGAFQEGCGPS